jgi:hypothetical protein
MSRENVGGLRPGGLAEQVRAGPPPRAFGVHLFGDDVCPQLGWWVEGLATVVVHRGSMSALRQSAP